MSEELLAQIGAGRDGVAYRARRPEGTIVEVRTLATASADPVRWGELARRLRLASLVEHPAARALLRLDLEGPVPRVVLEAAAGPPLARLAGPLPPLEALPLALEITGALRAAHRVGLWHNALSPEAVLCQGARVQVDLTGADTGCEGTGVPAGPTAPAADGRDLARLVVWLVTGRPFATIDDPSGVPEALAGRLNDFFLPADDRPGLADLEDRLRAALRQAQEQAGLSATHPEGEAIASASLPTRERLGRFRLLRRLGQGGMGEVYEARDLSDGRVVAVKTLLPEAASRPEMLRRFRKEARLLAEVNNPFVTNLLEINEDEGIHYLVVELVAGPSAGRRLESGKPFEERLALSILAAVCRALADAHARGIVHRDIKPDNILLQLDADSAPLATTLTLGPEPRPVAKLSDFGLARHVVESQSLDLTRTGAILGTPLYLSPEQCTGAAAGPPSDVYSAGATLFHLLTGRPPFLGDSPLALIHQHCNAPVPSPRAVNPTVSEAASRLVEKALAKSPAHRHADAGELLHEIECLLRGEPAPVEAHPRLPAGDPRRVLHYAWTWELGASPEQLWPHVSNTERLNRAIGLPAVDFRTAPDDEGRPRRRGSIRKLGLEAAWEEHPFEWVEGRRFGVVRECSSGPFRWLVSLVELSPRGGGTALTHRIRVLPSGLLGRTFAAVEIGLKTKRALDRVYRRIDAVARGQAGRLADPFEDAPRLSRAQARALEAGLDRLAGHGLPIEAVERFGAWLAAAPAQEVARIRPLALARRLGLPADEALAACLHAAREGLLVLLWDLLCPLCRIPSQVHDALRALKDHGQCAACNIEYAIDFARSVELIFRAAPAVRDTELGTYCIGGPAHSPHVVAQLRLAAGERAQLDVALAEGAYLVRGPQLPGGIDLRVYAGATTSRLEVDLARLPSPPARAALRPGGQVLVFANPHPRELVVRLERTADREDALTAARAASLALFRELFPGEVLSPGQLVRVATVTLLQTDLPEAAALIDRGEEARAFEQVHDHLRRLEALARRHAGALVKAVGAGGLMAFHAPEAAVAALVEIEPAARVALHRGPALAATINEQLDYFGATVRQTAALLEQARAGEWLLSQAVMEDPAAARQLRGREGEMRPGEVHRFVNAR